MQLQKWKNYPKARKNTRRIPYNWRRKKMRKSAFQIKVHFQRQTRILHLKMSEEVNFHSCGIELKKYNLRSYTETNHQKEELSYLYVDIENAHFIVPKTNRHQDYPLHTPKTRHSATDPYLSSERNFSLNYISKWPKSSLKNEL